MNTESHADAGEGVPRSGSRPGDGGHGVGHALRRWLMLLGAAASIALFYLIHVGVSVALLRVPLAVVAGVGIAVGVFGMLQTVFGYV